LAIRATDILRPGGNDLSPPPFGAFAPGAAQHAVISLAHRSRLKRGAFRPMLSRLVNLFRALARRLRHRLVMMLGTTDSYIKGCCSVVRSLHGATFSDIDEVSYRTGDVVWVHASHLSPLNGHHGPWMAGNPSTKPGRKQVVAKAAVRLSGAIS
jgi:hypothetical protein